MKRWLILALLTVAAAAQTVTPNLGLTKPAPGQTNWDAPINNDLSILDAASRLPGLAVTNYGLVCDGITNDSAALGALLNSVGTTPTKLTFPTGTCLIGSIRFPANVTLDFSSGGALSLIVDHTAPGGGSFVQGGGTSNPTASPTSSCSVTLNGTVGGANHAIVMMVALYKTYAPDNARISSVTDGSNFYIQQQETTLGQASYVASYLASSIGGGNVTVTANFSAAEKNACIAWEIAGLGPTPNSDGSGSFAYGTVTPFSSGAATFLSQDFEINYGEDPNDAQTCTAGAGYTQPASTAGNVSGTGGPALCAEYKLSGAGGSTTATQNFSTSPVLSSWGDALIGLRPGSATVTILGGIYNPDLHQIFYNATGTDGVVSFTGNTASFDVHPEWWGASSASTAAVNTPALQAAVHGAFGTNRSNGSGLSVWNKTLYLNENYQINDELQFYHVINFKVICGGRGTGITQTGVNKRIIDGQSIAYGAFYDCSWGSSVANTNALIDLDYNGVTTLGDLRPQFIDFYNNNFLGNSLTDTGVLIAKSGGAAQGSNIYFYDNAFQGFTGAGWQVGGNNTGRNVGRFYAQNALAIDMWGGDIQGSPLYGVAVYGGGYIGLHSVSMENNFLLQTGYDMYCEGTQGPCNMYDQRSESRKLIAGSTINVFRSALVNQAAFPVPGATQPLGAIMRGGSIAGDGAYYIVTARVPGFIGEGSQATPTKASAGSGTTIADTNQSISGSVTVGTVVLAETMTQAVTGSTGTVVTVPTSVGTITGSVTSGTIGTAHTMTQATTGITCTSTNAPTGTTSLTCNNFSGTADNSHIWTDGTTSGTYTPTAAPTFSATTMLITAATAAPDNSHNWVGGTSSAVFVPTTVPTSVAWTVNAFNGMLVSTATGTNALCYGVITANTADTITVAAGWVTKYPLTTCPGPDSTSTFYLEPAWNHGTVVDGGMTMVYMNEDVIGTPVGSVGFANSRLEDLTVPGGQIHVWSGSISRTIIKNVRASRTDWFNAAGGNPQVQGTSLDRDWDVQVYLPLGTAPIKWSLPASAGVTTYSGAQMQNMGTRPLVWNTGTIGGNGPPANVSANDVWVGGRSDPGAHNDATRSILEFGGMLGRAAALGTDQAGTDTDITGGPSTGTGAGGAINFWISTPGASSALINSGTKRASVDAQGWHPPSVTFAVLSAAPYTTSPNGSIVFCTDCKNFTDDTTGTFDSAAAGGGNGTTVLRENGAWRVH